MMQPHTHPRGDEIAHGITGARLDLALSSSASLQCVSCQLVVWVLRSAQLHLAPAKQVTHAEPDAPFLARSDSGVLL
jgi:hypothetical protein